MIEQTTLHRRIAQKQGGGDIGTVCKAESYRQNDSVSPHFPPLEIPNQPQALERSGRARLATSALNEPDMDQPRLNANPGGSAWV
jgi:hypothetical protein